MKAHFLQPPLPDQVFFWIFEKDERVIGVHKTLGWCTRLRSETPIYFDTESKCMVLLILLEIEFAEFKTHLDTVCEAAPEYAASIQRFPLALLLRHAFHSSVSDYWPDKAIDWLDANPEVQPLLLAELEHLVTNKAMSQSLRHRARRMFRNLQRAAELTA